MHQRLLAIAVFGLLVLVGCSAPETPTAAPSEVPAVTSAPSSPAEPSGPAPGGEVDSDALLDAISAAAKGVTSSTTEIKITLDDQGKKTESKISGAVDSSDPDRPKTSVSMDLGGQPVDIIMAGDDVYLRMELIGDQWLKMDRESMKAQGLEVPESVDQTDQLGKLSGGVTKAIFVGDEQVNGVAARHYQLMVDPKLLEIDSGEKLGSEMVYELWLNGDNLPVRFRFATENQSGGSMVFEGFVTGYNEPVSIKIPSESEIMPEE